MIRRLLDIIFVAVFCVFFVVGCGGSSGDSTTKGDTPVDESEHVPQDDTSSDDNEDISQDNETVDLLSGVFIDSPVEGLDYYALPSGQAGITDVRGTFKYQQKDTEVKFMLGELEIGSASPANVITPYDIAGAEGLITGKVGRTARLLQSLDDDGDISSSIRITEETKGAVGTGSTVYDYDLALTSNEYEAAYAKLLNRAGKSDVGIESAETHMIASTSLYDECDDYPDYEIFFGDLYANCHTKRRLFYYLNDVSKHLRSETASYTSLIRSNESIAFDRVIQERVLSAGDALKRYTEVYTDVTKLLSDPDISGLDGGLIFISLVASFTDAAFDTVGVFITNEEWITARSEVNKIVTAVIKSVDCASVMTNPSQSTDSDYSKCVKAAIKVGSLSGQWFDSELVEKIVLSMRFADVATRAQSLYRKYKQHEEAIGKEKANLALEASILVEDAFVLVFDEVVGSDDSMPALGIFRGSVLNIFNTYQCVVGFKSVATSVRSGKTDGLTQEVKNCADAITGVIDTVVSSSKLTTGGVIAKGLSTKVNEIILTQLVIEEMLLHGNETTVLQQKWDLGDWYSTQELVEAVAKKQGLSIDYFGALDFGWLLQKNEYSPERVSQQVALWMNYIAAIEKSDILQSQIWDQPVLTVSNVIASEADGVIRFELSLSEAAPTDITLAYTTFRSSSVDAATPALDYDDLSGDLVVREGETTGYVEVPLYDDDILEQEEYLKLHVADTNNQVLIVNSIAIGVISDNEPLAYTANQNHNTSLVKYKDSLFTLVSTSTGLSIKKIDPETLEVSTVFEIKGGVTTSALGSSSEGLHIFYRYNSDEELNFYTSINGVNWGLESTQPLPATCTSELCVIKSYHYDSEDQSHLLVIDVSWYARYLFDAVSGTYNYIDGRSLRNGSPLYPYLSSGTLLQLRASSSQSAGYASLNLYQASIENNEFEQVASTPSYFASIRVIVARGTDSGYEYLWTGKGSNEGSRVNYYGVDNEGYKSEQNCISLNTELKNIRAPSLTLGRENGDFFEWISEQTDTHYVKAIYKWEDAIECHLSLVGTNSIPKTYGLVDTVSTDDYYFSLYSQSDQQPPVLQRYDLTGEGIERVILSNY